MKKIKLNRTNKKLVKLTKEQEAIIYLATMMENPMHHDYKLRMHILDILGLEYVKNNQ